MMTVKLVVQKENRKQTHSVGPLAGHSETAVVKKLNTSGLDVVLRLPSASLTKKLNPTDGEIKLCFFSRLCKYLPRGHVNECINPKSIPTVSLLAPIQGYEG